MRFIWIYSTIYMQLILVITNYICFVQHLQLKATMICLGLWFDFRCMEMPKKIRDTEKRKILHSFDFFIEKTKRQIWVKSLLNSSYRGISRAWQNHKTTYLWGYEDSMIAYASYFAPNIILGNEKQTLNYKTSTYSSLGLLALQAKEHSQMHQCSPVEPFLRNSPVNHYFFLVRRGIHIPVKLII